MLDVPQWLVAPPPKDPKRAMLWVRWKARTDLIWFCNNILGYPDVNMKQHGVMVSRLQQFPAPRTIEEAAKLDRWDEETGRWYYQPLNCDKKFHPRRVPDPFKLPGKRRRLILDFRNSLKSTVNLKAHTIQWVINFPDVEIILFQSTVAKIKEVVSPVKQFFCNHDRFREVFPELCMNEEDSTSDATFTTPGRTPGCVFDMPTVQGLSMDQSQAGKHVHVIKYSDVVDEKNCKNPEILQEITKAFYMSENLLKGNRFWMDVEGTRYSPLDMYGKIIEDEMGEQTRAIAWIFKKKIHFYKEDAIKAAGPDAHKIIEKRNVYVPTPERRTWEVYINCCWERDYAKFDKPPSYDYDDLKCPPLIDRDGNYVARWPERESAESLRSKARRDEYMFSCQQLNDPKAANDESSSFRMDIFPSLVMPMSVFRQKIRVAYYEMVTDTAEADHGKACYSVIGTGAIDSSGECYIIDVDFGRWLGPEFVDRMYKMYMKWDGGMRRVSRVTMEEVPYTKGLKHYIQRFESMKGMSFPMSWLRRPGGKTSTGKTGRIKGLLGTRYSAKEVHFVVPDNQINEEDWPDWLKHLKLEMENFMEPEPLWYVDMMDAFADFFNGKAWQGREAGRPNAGQQLEDAHRMMFRIDNHPTAREATLPEYEQQDLVSANSDYWDCTGGL